MTDMVIDKY